MAQAEPNNEAMKQVLKEALAEALHEQRELLHEVFAEVLEDFAFSEAIRRGRKTEYLVRGEISCEGNRLEVLHFTRDIWKNRDDLPDFGALRREFDERSTSAAEQ